MLHPTEAPTEAERAQTPGTERGQPRDGQSRPVRRDIEGLRSIAVLFVLGYHLGVQRLSGGFAGVDVFFVISGFLITSGLVSEAERTGSVALLRFYARRARRLLPAATLVLVLTAVVGWWVLPRADWSVLSSDVTTAALYVVNWALAFRSVDYLAEDTGLSPVQHYWSLSVEEQFYVVIPILMIVLAWAARRLGWSVRGVIAAGLGSVVAASFAYSVVHTAAAPQTAYFFSTTRAWELGVGSLVACAVPLLRPLPRRVAGPVAILGLTAILASGLVFSTSTPWPGSAALLPTLGTAAVLMAGIAHQRTLVARALGVAPLVWVGGLSYSIYLWHWPLIVLAGNGVELTHWHRVGIVVATFLAAWLSKRLVEDPIRFGAWTRGTRRALTMATVGMACSVLAAGFVALQAPRLTAKPAEVQGALALMAPTGDPATGPQLRADVSSAITRDGLVYPEPAAETLDVPRYYADACQVGPGAVAIARHCVYGAKDGAFTVALVGDSKAGQWFSVIDTLATQRGWRLEVYLKDSCGLNPAATERDCRAYNARVMEHLTSPAGRVDLVMTSAGRSRDPGSDDVSQERYIRGYDEYWKALEAVGTPVVVIGDVPRVGGKGVNTAACIEEHPDDFLACTFPANEGTGTVALRRAAELNPDRVFVDVLPYVCPQTVAGRCPAVVGRAMVYRQGSHVTKTYADSMRPLFDRALHDVEGRQH